MEIPNPQKVKDVPSPERFRIALPIPPVRLIPFPILEAPLYGKTRAGRENLNNTEGTSELSVVGWWMHELGANNSD